VLSVYISRTAVNQRYTVLTLHGQHCVPQIVTKVSEITPDMLEELIKELKYNGLISNQEDFGAQLGYKKSYTSKVVNGHKKPSDLRETIAKKFPSVSPTWLEAGTGPILTSAARLTRPVIEVEQVPEDDFMMAADLTEAEAVAGFIASGGSEAYVETLPKLLLPKEYGTGNYLVIRVTGKSMETGPDSGILADDKLLCKQVFWSKGEKPLHKRDCVYVIAHRDGGLACKEIIDHNVRSGLCVCHSWNPDWQDYTIFLEDVIALFEVKKLVDRSIRPRGNQTVIIRK